LLKAVAVEDVGVGKKLVGACIANHLANGDHDGAVLLQATSPELKAA
jgi:hypothetical protein